MNLSAMVSASAFDDDYQMALVYCIDKAKNYCFSLSRVPDESRIEVMVLDQVSYKVADLSVRLKGEILEIALNRDVAAQLDGHTLYTIELLNLNGAQQQSLHAALRKIFEGKLGLQIIP